MATSNSKYIYSFSNKVAYTSITYNTYVSSGSSSYAFGLSAYNDDGTPVTIKSEILLNGVLVGSTTTTFTDASSKTITVSLSKRVTSGDMLSLVIRINEVSGDYDFWYDVDNVSFYCESNLVPVIDFLSGGKGVAMGKAATESNVFDCAYSANFDGRVSANGKFRSEYGLSIPFGNDSWWDIDTDSQGNLSIGYTRQTPGGGLIGGNERVLIDHSATNALETLILYHGTNLGGRPEGTLLDLIYPVGAVYLSFSSTSPASLFGGSWTKITSGYLQAASNTNSGGSSSHSHAARGSLGARIAINTDKYIYYNYGTASGSAWTPNYWLGGSNVNVGSSSITYRPNSGAIVEGSTASASANPPYQNLHVWRRTA